MCPLCSMSTIDRFDCNFKLKAHFENLQKKVRFTKDIFKNPTSKTWIPNNKHHSKEIFIEATRNEINNETEKTKRPNYFNLSAKEQKALQELQVRHDIVITHADKDGAVVKLDVENYIKETERQLYNTENYKRLNDNPTAINNKIVNKIIKRFQKENLISKNSRRTGS